MFFSKPMEIPLDTDEYVEKAKRSESVNYDEIRQRLASTEMIRVLHAALGVATEAGELLDAVKKHVYYGKPLDRVNLFEEVGDLFWYMAILADELGFSFDDAMKKNIAKLEARYKSGFTQEAALHRDLAKEMSALTKGQPANGDTHA